MNNNGANDLTVRIENSTDPTRMRLTLEIPRPHAEYDIAVAEGRLTEILKVADALQSLECFTHIDGSPLSKAELFRIFGLILHVDTKHVNQMLNYAYRLNTCTRIFFQMSKYVEKRHNG